MSGLWKKISIYGCQLTVHREGAHPLTLLDLGFLRYCPPLVSQLLDPKNSIFPNRYGPKLSFELLISLLSCTASSGAASSLRSLQNEMDVEQIHSTQFEVLKFTLIYYMNVEISKVCSKINRFYIILKLFFLNLELVENLKGCPLLQYCDQSIKDDIKLFHPDKF